MLIKHIPRATLVLVTLALTACGSSSNLDISAKTEDGFVYVRNNSATSYSDCLASINGNYFLKHQDLPVSGQLKMSSFSFANSDSERFSPVSHKISSVSLSCGNSFGGVEF